MYRILLLCLLFCVSCQEKEPCDYIESYYQDVYKAELAYWEKDYQKAYDLLKEVESRCGLLNQSITREPEMMAKLSIKVGKPQAAFPYIERMLKEGMSFNSFVNNDVFNILHEYEEWRYLERNAARFATEFKEGIDKELREEVIAMNNLDQVVRQKPVDYVEMKRIDSIHQLRIKEIFKAYGYPSTKILGKDNIQMGERVGLRTLFFHFDDTTYFKPILHAMIRNGEAPADILGTMLDSQQRPRGVFDYGIYDNVDSSRIKNFKNLDERRISVGLPPWKLKKKVDSLRRAYYNTQY
ncbi:hypothetical protein [uncultured Dokdonia sp.]|uniref:hypothetical protein n=1 Tax=uncultured Dokdonia sp. TaxID=575653 RepID=UPI002603E772|nr:hypothetical protein [uncultured Dokdonia sp.]